MASSASALKALRQKVTLEAARRLELRVTTPAMLHSSATPTISSAARRCVSTPRSEGAAHGTAPGRGSETPASRTLARGPLAVVFLQVALADADALGRDLHQLVVGDELHRVLERQLDRRRDLDRVFLAADAEVGELLLRTALTTRSLSRLWMPTIMPS
jgi:hypothetical protein